MRFAVNGFEAFRADMSVNLRGAQICVSEKFLNTAQVRAGVQKMRCKGMAEFVRRHVGRQTRFCEIQFEVALETARSQPSAVLIDEQRHTYCCT